MSRILIAEDEPRLSSFLEKGLRSAGYSTTVCDDGIRCETMARDREFDLLILDVGLPGQDGFAVLRSLRARGEKLPVVILTARDDVVDTVTGLDSGADDYMTKPFVFEELLARVRARLRSPEQGDARARAGGRRRPARRPHAPRGRRWRRGRADGQGVHAAGDVPAAPGAGAQPRAAALATSGATTSTPDRTSSTSTSATCARSSARSASRPCAAWATGSSRSDRPEPPHQFVEPRAVGGRGLQAGVDRRASTSAVRPRADGGRPSTASPVAAS